MKQPFTFSTEDVKTFVLEQIERDSKDPSFLTLEEYRAMLNML